MANDDIKYTLNVQTVDNPLTEDPKDTRFVLVSNGTADFDRVVSEIMALNPGLERETVEAVIRFEHRVIKRLTLNGMRVSNGLFSAVASPKGRGGSAWDPAVNTLDITIAQGADWREAIRIAARPLLARGLERRASRTGIEAPVLSALDDAEEIAANEELCRRFGAKR